MLAHEKRLALFVGALNNATGGFEKRQNGFDIQTK
jgi:hypothetical protein